MLYLHCPQMPITRYTKAEGIIYALFFALISMLFTAIAYGGTGNAKEILTPEERLWITNNQSRIVLAVETGYAPFVFLDAQGQPTGLAHDYIRLIESKIGVSFKQQQFSSLSDIFERVRAGDAYIVNAVTKTPARLQFLTFTDPFISVPNVIIVRKDRPGRISEHELSGFKVSLVQSYAITEYMTNRDLPFNPDLVPDDLSALLSVSFGRSDASVIDLATASYLISEKGITNLRVAGDMAHDIRLSIATPLNAPVLHDIIQKGLNAITDAERLEIKNRWINISKPQNIFKDRQFWIALGSVLAIAFTILAIVLIWNRSLQRQIVLRKEAEENIKAAALYSRSLFEASLDPLMAISPEGKITDANIATERITGIQREHLIGSNFTDYFTDPGKACEAYQQAFSQGFVTNYPLAIRHVSGKITSVRYNASVYRDDNGDVLGVFAAARDITESEQIEKALLKSEALFKTMFNEAPLGIALIDSLTGQVYSVNPMFAKIAGRTMEEMANIDWMGIAHPDDVQEDLDNMALLNAGKITGFHMEKRYIQRNGAIVWINMTIAPIYVEDKAHPRHLSMIEDITERKITEKHIKELAFYDPLTQLPNRRLLHERLKYSINEGRRGGKRPALLMLDLDRFKEVNDTLGHLAGDELLQQVALRITERLRDVDMVARLGGDEFIVLLDDIARPEDAAQVANEIIAALTRPFCLAQSDHVQIGASIGISLYPQHGNSPEQLLDHADAAMYQAKDSGRGCFAYFSEDLARHPKSV